MSIPVLIIGRSGTGKTTSLRNVDPKKSILIQALKKPLPFKSTDWMPWSAEKKEGSLLVSDKAKTIIKCIEKAAEYGKEIIVIDDFQYQMSGQFMRRANEKGYQKFTDIAKDVWDIVQAVINSPDNLRVYILSHTQEDEYGENVKMKTIGKMLDDKVTIEGMFSIVLRSILNDGEYRFTTKNSGSDTVKSPMGLFESAEIDNDLKEIDLEICDYYGIYNKELNYYQNALEMAEALEDQELKKTALNSIEKFKTNNDKLKKIIKKLTNKG